MQKSVRKCVRKSVQNSCGNPCDGPGAKRQQKADRIELNQDEPMTLVTHDWFGKDSWCGGLACLPACLPACRPACLLACLPACRPVYTWQTCYQSKDVWIASLPAVERVWTTDAAFQVLGGGCEHRLGCVCSLQ